MAYGGGAELWGGGRAVGEGEGLWGKGDRNFPFLLRVSGHLGALNVRIQTEASS